jgi:CRP/FNR family transcriptional regulator, dissimilatory nitrate respiration regulator
MHREEYGESEDCLGTVEADPQDPAPAARDAMPKDALGAARRSALLAALPAAAAESLLARGTIRCFRKGETIFVQNEQARFIHVVLDGWVKLYRMTESGSEAVIAVFSAGQSFGEAIAFLGFPYPVNGEAVADCRLLQIETRAFGEVVRFNPDCVEPILSAMYHHLHALIVQIEALKARTGSQRVASFLLELCDVSKGRAEVTLPHDKVLVAGRLGMKPESLSRAFSRLGRDAGVRIRGNVATIQDVETLRRFSVRDPALAWSRSG